MTVARTALLHVELAGVFKADQKSWDGRGEQKDRHEPVEGEQQASHREQGDAVLSCLDAGG